MMMRKMQVLDSQNQQTICFNLLFLYKELLLNTTRTAPIGVKAWLFLYKKYY